jgi:hypothetical protein
LRELGHGAVGRVQKLENGFILVGHPSTIGCRIVATRG